MSSTAKDPANSGSPRHPQPITSPQDNLITLTRRAFEVATAAVSNAADSVSSPALTQAVFDCEKELDSLDRQMDERFATVLTQSSPEQVRELLACMKCMIDLERIGDLVSSFVSRCRIVATRLEMQDISDLINMNSHLEAMLKEVSHAFGERDLSRAIGVLRSDREIDRIRNLIFLRHLEDQASCAGPDSIHVLLMSQALERAGDHAKNLAEEICHLVSGHSVRHVLRAYDRPVEQMFIEELKKRQK